MGDPASGSSAQVDIFGARNRAESATWRSLRNPKRFVVNDIDLERPRKTSAVDTNFLYCSSV